MSDHIKRAIEALKNGVDAKSALAIALDKDVVETEEGQNVGMTLSFFIRCLEWSREMAKDDVSIHKFAEAVYAANHPKEGEDDVTVTSKQFDDILKKADEMTTSVGTGGFIGGMGPSRSYPVKKKAKKVKKGSKNESILEYYRERPCIRIELDCVEFMLQHAGDTKFNKKKARDLTNALARQYSGTYDPLSEYDVKQVLQSVEDAEREESVSEEGDDTSES